MLGLYRLFVGSKASFLAQFEGEGKETLYQQAMLFWNKLDSWSLLLFIVAIIIGLFGAWYYYVPYNKQAHRHYLVRHWVKFLVVNLVVCLVASGVFAFCVAKPIIMGAVPFLLKLAMGNALYAAFVYVLISLVWCNTGLNTNAYRFLKFKK